jgi:selenium metabolism protein YedF
MKLNNDFLLVLDSAGLGEGEPDLGEKLMKAFLNVLLESGELPAKIIFMNSGVFLTTEGSPALEILTRYQEQGAELLSCGTCLEYYGRKEKLRVGDPTNMKDTVQAMMSFPKVLKP